MEAWRLAELGDADNAVLLVIDLQGKIFSLAFNHQRLKTTVSKVLRLAELFEVPVVLTEQYPKGLGQTDADLRRVFDALTTETHALEKDAFGCCAEPGFDALLRQVADGVGQRRGGDLQRPVDIVVVGIETQVCVQQTVLQLLGQGYRVVVLQDCVGTRIEEYQQIALARFRQCGAIVSTFESLAFEWTRTRTHPRFKQVSALIKEP